MTAVVPGLNSCDEAPLLSSEIGCTPIPVVDSGTLRGVNERLQFHMLIV